MRKLKKKLKREQCFLSRKYKNIKKRGEEATAKKRANIDKNINRVRNLNHVKKLYNVYGGLRRN